MSLLSRIALDFYLKCSELHPKVLANLCREAALLLRPLQKNSIVISDCVSVCLSLLSLSAMEELDGDEVRVSSRGRLAERDIVQVLFTILPDVVALPPKGSL